MTFTIARVLILAGGLIANVGGGGGAAWAQETRGFFADPGHGSWQSVNIGTNFTVIQRFSALPPGKYLAHASAVLASSDPLFRYVDCGFTIGRNLQSDLARGVVGGTGVDNFVSLPLTLGFTLTTAQTLAVACRADVADAVVSQPSPITIIKVDRLTVQRGFQP
jgi:hypothetical protein